MIPARRARIPLLLLAALLAAGCDRGTRQTNIDRLAPAFTLTDGSQTASLAALHGKVVVLNFWATWCAPCVEELPSLNDLEAHLPPHTTLLGIATDEDAAAYGQFLTTHPISFPTVRDPQQQVNTVYGTSQFPETYIIDKAGRIRRKFIGPQNWTSPDILDYLRHLAAE